MISLITATLGRINEFRILLESLKSQTYKDYELIVVDQNEHDYIEKIIRDFQKLNVRYIKSKVKGLSYNRNIGLKYACGEIIGFPDDDCFYDDNLLKEVTNYFMENETRLDLVAVSVKDTITSRVFLAGNDLILDRKQLFYKCISYNFFIRKICGMKFDVELGVGAFYGSGEETDFLWTFLNKDFRGILINTTYVHHPANIGAVNHKRAYKYGLGFGAIMKKEVVQRRHYDMLSIYIIGLIRAIGGILFRRGKKSYLCSLCGRIIGFIKK